MGKFKELAIGSDEQQIALCKQWQVLMFGKIIDSDIEIVSAGVVGMGYDKNDGRIILKEA